MRLCCWYYCSPVAGLLLLSGDEIRDGSGIQIGQRDGESAEDGVVSNSVNNPFVLPLYGRCYFTGGGEAIGWWLIFELLDEEVPDDYPLSPALPEGTSSTQTLLSGLLWSRVCQPQDTGQTACSPTWTHTSSRSWQQSCHAPERNLLPEVSWHKVVVTVVCQFKLTPPLPLFLADGDVAGSSAHPAERDYPPPPRVLLG